MNTAKPASQCDVHCSCACYICGCARARWRCDLLDEVTSALPPPSPANTTKLEFRSSEARTSEKNFGEIWNATTVHSISSAASLLSGKHPRLKAAETPKDWKSEKRFRDKGPKSEARIVLNMITEANGQANRGYHGSDEYHTVHRYIRTGF